MYTRIFPDKYEDLAQSPIDNESLRLELVKKLCDDEERYDSMQLSFEFKESETGEAYGSGSWNPLLEREETREEVLKEIKDMDYIAPVYQLKFKFRQMKYVHFYTTLTEAELKHASKCLESFPVTMLITLNKPCECFKKMPRDPMLYKIRSPFNMLINIGNPIDIKNRAILNTWNYR